MRLTMMDNHFSEKKNYREVHRLKNLVVEEYSSRAKYFDELIHLIICLLKFI